MSFFIFSLTLFQILLSHSYLLGYLVCQKEVERYVEREFKIICGLHISTDTSVFYLARPLVNLIIYFLETLFSLVYMYSVCVGKVDGPRGL